MNMNISLSQDVPVTEELSHLESLQNEKSFSDTTDILQQAITEAGGYSEIFALDTEIPGLTENSQHLNDHSYMHSRSDSSGDRNVVNLVDKNINENKNKISQQQVASLSEPTVSEINTRPLLSSSFAESTKKICINSSLLPVNNSNDVFTSATSSVSNSPNLCNSNNNVVIVKPSTQPVSSHFIFKAKEIVQSSAALSSSEACVLKLPIKQTDAPLGSLENPIQLIRHGDSYRTTRVLSQTHLQQIAHILNQADTKKILQNRSRSVVYDPFTKTRLVCRIVHPSEVQSKSSESKVTPQPSISKHSANNVRGKGRHRKPANRKTDDDEKNKLLLSKEEREEKKKHRPRTRSGRISKPPSYMVKDYKRIHHLDFNEEPYDDSDGGYSDYHVSEEEADKSEKSGNLPPGVTTSKRRTFSCSVCNKAYIGKGGLSRHYRLNPNHGNFQEIEGFSTQDENSNSSLASSVLSNTNSQNSSFVIPSSKVDIQSPSSSQASAESENSINKRRSKLKEILKDYSVEDIAEVALPKIVQNVPLWDFFISKYNTQPNGLNIYEMLREFENFLTHIQQFSSACLSPASNNDEGKTVINISSSSLADALSLKTGAYAINSNVTISRHFQPVASSSPNNTLDCVDESPSLKRRCLVGNVKDVNARLPEQILSENQDGENFELSFTEKSHTDTQKRNLNVSLSNSENHEVVTTNLFDLNSSTVVTPSSLSSGCLSAVNSFKSHLPVSLLAKGPPQLPIKKIQLFNVPDQQLRNSNALSSNPFAFHLNDSSAAQAISKEPIIAPKQIDVCENNVVSTNTAFQGLPLDSNIDIFNSTIQEPVVLDSQAVPNTECPNQMLTTESTNALNDSTPAIPVPGEGEGLITCLPISDIANPLPNSCNIVAGTGGIQALVPSEVNINSGVEESVKYQIQPGIITEAPKAESSMVLRHVMLPDGQVISVWTPVERSEKTVCDQQFVQSYIPGNLIILQNPDGSIQVPSDQAISAETLQTLVSNQGLAPIETQSFTAVQPM